MVSKVGLNGLHAGVVWLPVPSDASGRLKIQSDASAGWFRVITGQDWFIHQGKHFFVKGVMDVEDLGTVVYMMFITPDTATEINAFALVTAESQFLLEIYEDAQVSDNGTPITYFNNNRNSAVTAELRPFSSPTVTDEGTLIWSAETGTSVKPTGVSMGTNYKILPKRNSHYLWKITKLAAGTHYVDYDFFWFENGCVI